MNSNIITILQYTYTTILPFVLTYIVKTIKDIKETKNVGKEADMLILRLILVDMHDKCVEQGSISNQTYVTFNEVWELYHDKLNGNHLTEKFKKEVDALPIRRESWED